MIPRYEILPQFEIISVLHIIVAYCYQSKNIYLLQGNILFKKKEYKYISFLKKQQQQQQKQALLLQNKTGVSSLRWFSKFAILSAMAVKL